MRPKRPASQTLARHTNRKATKPGTFNHNLNWAAISLLPPPGEPRAPPRLSVIFSPRSSHRRFSSTLPARPFERRSRNLLSLNRLQSVFILSLDHSISNWQRPLMGNHSTRRNGSRLSLPAASLSLLESALPKNAPVTPLQSTDPKTTHLKSFRIRRSEKRWGEGGKLLTSQVSYCP